MMADRSARSNDMLRESIATSMSTLSNRLEDISKAEISARDRVDISLAECERMKEQIRTLESENGYLRDILSNLRLPLEHHIIPDSIVTEWSHDLKCFVTHWQIRFDTEDIR
jgi:hypothetical protein